MYDTLLPCSIIITKTKETHCHKFSIQGKLLTAEYYVIVCLPSGPVNPLVATTQWLKLSSLRGFKRLS